MTTALLLLAAIAVGVLLGARSSREFDRFQRWDRDELERRRWSKFANPTKEPRP